MTQNPHDALFRYTFSQPKHAAGLLKSVLPESLVARTDWSSLALEPGSFVDEQLSARHTDLLFHARIDEADAFIFLLVEHQSTADPQMPLRMLRYVMRV